MTQPRTKPRPYRYDGLDEYGQHWGEHLDESGEPTEEYFLLPGPSLAEAAGIISELMGCLEYPIDSKSVRESAIDLAADFLARIQAHQPEAEAWFSVGVAK